MNKSHPVHRHSLRIIAGFTMQTQVLFDAYTQGYTGHRCATNKPLLHMTGIREPVDLGHHLQERKMRRLLYGFQTAGPCEPQVARCFFGLCQEHVSVTRIAW